MKDYDFETEEERRAFEEGLDEFEASKYAERREMQHTVSLLRAARISRGLTQEELAQAIGYKSGQSVANYENLFRPIPFKTAVRLAIALGISPERLDQAMGKDNYQTIVKLYEEEKS